MNDSIFLNIEDIPKSDLHVHFNGAVPTDIIKRLISELDITVPSGLDLEVDLQILDSVNGLNEYFKPWRIFKLLPVGYNSLQIMMIGAFKKLSEDNVRYIEIRNSPFYIGRINNISLEEALLWLLESINVASEMFNIDARLILSLTRHEYKNEDAHLLISAIKKVNSNGVIVGVDLSGDEDYILNKRDLSKFFLNVKFDLGLGVTIHAGETGNEENVEWAINECKADRIGHGLASAKSNKILELIKEKNVCLEVCLTSNIMSGCCSSITSHPISMFIEHDIPFVLCTDNPRVHNITLTDEYSVFLKHFGDRTLLNKIIANSTSYSFRKFN
ncbi:hypothetical protein [Paenibacillus sp. 481]|uniref:hypothetical protein n=1 Tax=Paenibacillus sp. 481 TaxID=2835869 RepID=UPI001E2D2AD7|nr:hypothetical protein [Paenibacillus sp. 481]UHA73069.1 hypothetical protein KIK04_21125 [Paenibacillus sp. 481]